MAHQLPSYWHSCDHDQLAKSVTKMITH